MALRREHLILYGPKTNLSGIFLAYNPFTISNKPAPFELGFAGSFRAGN